MCVIVGEEYKSIVERREIIRNEFHDKMVETARVRVNISWLLELHYCLI